MKITPAHDFLDFEIGKRHNLPINSVINSAGNIECTSLKRYNFNNKPRFHVREAVFSYLIRNDLYRLANYFLCLNDVKRLKCLLTSNILNLNYISQYIGFTFYLKLLRCFKFYAPRFI